MKRCPECRRDYHDDSLLYCLEDGTALVQGAVDEPQTALLGTAGFSPSSGAAASGGALGTEATRVFANSPPHENPQSEIRSPHSEGPHEVATANAPKTFDKRLVVAPLILAVIILAGFFGYRYVTQAEQIDSIAVMPFVNDSGNADVEYLSDGLTETLISSLSKLGDLSVKARSAVFSYKGRDVSAKQIGEELGVQAVLLGRLAQRGETIRLNLELVNPRTLDVIWSEQYDRKQADLVNLQAEIARDVSSKLRSKLSGETEQALTKKYTEDPEAYRLYLQGRFYLNKRVGKEYQKAEAFLREAIARDPNFALGYIGLAEFVGQRDRAKGKEYIMRALALDNQFSDAHGMLGFQFMLDRDWITAEKEMKRAIELDPENPRAHQWNGTRLMMVGRFDECLVAFDRAIALEPTLPDLRNNRGSCLVAAGRVDEGIAEVKKAMEIDPSYAWTYSHLSFLYRMKGDYPAAVEARATAAEKVDRPDLAARLRDSFRESGWRGYLHELLDQTTDHFPNAVRKASILTELGRSEEALASLEESAAKGEWWLFSIKYDPAFDPLRRDPRFQALMKQFEWPG